MAASFLDFTKFYEYCADGDLEKCKEYHKHVLSSNISVDIATLLKNTIYCPCICIAYKKGHHHIVKWFIDEAADGMNIDIAHQYMLKILCITENISEIIKFIETSPSNINIFPDNLIKSLGEVCPISDKYIEVVEILLASNIHYNDMAILDGYPKKYRDMLSPYIIRNIGMCKYWKRHSRKQSRRDISDRLSYIRSVDEYWKNLKTYFL